MKELARLNSEGKLLEIISLAKDFHDEAKIFYAFRLMVEIGGSFAPNSPVFLSPSADGLWTAANIAFEMGDYKTAKIKTIELLSLTKGRNKNFFVHALHFLGSIYIAQGELESSRFKNLHHFILI